MNCRNDAEEGCKGLTLHHLDKKVSIVEDSCYSGSFKVIYIKKHIFKDKSELYYDSDVIFCADAELLSEISDAIDKFLVSLER